MANATTIQLKKESLKILKEAKEYPRQSYDELVKKMAKFFINLKNRNQYDEFLHKVQKQKMKELWDNSEDEVWESV